MFKKVKAPAHTRFQFEYKNYGIWFVFGNKYGIKNLAQNRLYISVFYWDKLMKCHQKGITLIK